MEYPANVRIVRVPCTGKVDVMLMLRAFQKGADGVYCVGCLEGTCHYNAGNLRCRERVEHVQSMLDEMGLEKERVRMYNLSSGEGPTFAAYAKEMTAYIKEVGPSPLSSANNENE